MPGRAARDLVPTLPKSNLRVRILQKSPEATGLLAASRQAVEPLGLPVSADQRCVLLFGMGGGGFSTAATISSDNLARQQTMADETGPYKPDVQASSAQPSSIEHEISAPFSLDGSQQRSRKAYLCASDTFRNVWRIEGPYIKSSSLAQCRSAPLISAAPQPVLNWLPPAGWMRSTVRVCGRARPDFARRKGAELVPAPFMQAILGVGLWLSEFASHSETRRLTSKNRGFHAAVSCNLCQITDGSDIIMWCLGGSLNSVSRGAGDQW